MKSDPETLLGTMPERLGKDFEIAFNQRFRLGLRFSPDAERSALMRVFVRGAPHAEHITAAAFWAGWCDAAKEYEVGA